MIEHAGAGLLYLMGCNFNGNIAVASTRVFDFGTHFFWQAWDRERYGLPGEQVRDAGFVLLDTAQRAQVHQVQHVTHLKTTVPAGKTSANVALQILFISNAVRRRKPRSGSW